MRVGGGGGTSFEVEVCWSEMWGDWTGFGGAVRVGIDVVQVVMKVDGAPNG